MVRLVVPGGCVAAERRSMYLNEVPEQVGAAGARAAVSFRSWFWRRFWRWRVFLVVALAGGPGETEAVRTEYALEWCDVRQRGSIFFTTGEAPHHRWVGAFFFIFRVRCRLRSITGLCSSLLGSDRPDGRARQGRELGAAEIKAMERWL